MPLFSLARKRRKFFIVSQTPCIVYAFWFCIYCDLLLSPLFRSCFFFGKRCLKCIAMHNRSHLDAISYAIQIETKKKKTRKKKKTSTKTTKTCATSFGFFYCCCWYFDCFFLLTFCHSPKKDTDEYKEIFLHLNLDGKGRVDESGTSAAAWWNFHQKILWWKFLKIDKNWKT